MSDSSRVWRTLSAEPLYHIWSNLSDKVITSEMNADHIFQSLHINLKDYKILPLLIMKVHYFILFSFHSKPIRSFISNSWFTISLNNNCFFKIATISLFLLISLPPFSLSSSSSTPPPIHFCYLFSVLFCFFSYYVCEYIITFCSFHLHTLDLTRFLCWYP